MSHSLPENPAPTPGELLEVPESASREVNSYHVASVESSSSEVGESSSPEGGDLPSGEGQEPRRPIGVRLVAPLAFLVAGILVMLYPVVATVMNNRAQHEEAVAYEKAITETTDRSRIDAALREAEAYNRDITGIPVLDPYLEKVTGDPSSADFNRYKRQLADFGPMGKVRVPSVNIDLPVSHGTSTETLAKGVGHLYGTSLPVGGEGTHSVLTTHTAFSNATLFDHRIDVKKGDLFFVDVYGKTLTYKVDQITRVLPDEISEIAPVAGKDYVTLMTCTPYAVNTHRLLVRGHRVPTPSDASSRPDDSFHIEIESWMWKFFAGTAAGVGLLVFLVRREKKNRDDAGPVGS